MGRAPVFGPSKSQWELIGVLCILAGVAFIPLWIGVTTWSDHQALKDEWRIAGPPCPLAARPWPIGPIKPKRFSYRGAAFERRYGAVWCEAVPDDGLFRRTSHTVCQFTSPGQLAVATAHRRILWEPGVGRPATVTLREGRIACVVGGWFGL
jgi:hypothetical protein